MLFLSTLTILLLLNPTSTLAQKAKAASKKSSSSSSSSSSRDQDKQLSRYLSLASSNDGVLEIQSPQEFQQLVSSPRSFSVSALLTATEGNIKCQPCNTFAPEYQNVARGWSKSQHKKRHIFAKLEFAKGQQVFQSVSEYERGRERDWKIGREDGITMEGLVDELHDC